MAHVCAPSAVKAFSKWMLDKYTSMVKDPSLVTDSMAKAGPAADIVYNQ